jgi:hypothetical protein
VGPREGAVPAGRVPAELRVTLQEALQAGIADHSLEPHHEVDGGSVGEPGGGGFSEVAQQLGAGDRRTLEGAGPRRRSGAMPRHAERGSGPSVHGGQTTARMANGQSAEIPIRGCQPTRVHPS